MHVPEDVRQRLREIYAEVPGHLMPQVTTWLRALGLNPGGLTQHVSGVLFCRRLLTFTIRDTDVHHSFAIAVKEIESQGWSIVEVGYMVERPDRS